MENIRQKAEAILRNECPLDRLLLDSELSEVIQELQIHKIELELQNDELHKTCRRLEATQAKYSELYDRAPVGYFTLDFEGRILELNLKGADLLSRERHRLIGKPLASHLQPQSMLTFFLHLRQCLATNKPQRCELVLNRISDNHPTCIQMESQVAFDNHDKFIGIWSVAMDITDRKQTEMTLAFERAQLLSIFDSIDQMIYVSDPETYEILYVNKHLAERIGQDAVGKTCYQQLQGFESPCAFCNNKKLLQDKGKSFRWEHYNPVLDRHYMITDRLIKWPDGREVRFELAVDITEQKQSEKTLERELHVQTALTELYKPLISPNSTIKMITDTVLRWAKKLTNSIHGYVSEIDPHNGDNICHTFTEMLKGHCQVIDEAKQISFPRKPDGTYNGLWGHALNTRQGFYTNTPQTHPATTGTPKGHIPLKAFLSVPVMMQERLVGQIALANTDQFYTDNDLEVIQRLAEFYALAIQRQRAEKALQHTNDKLFQAYDETLIGWAKALELRDRETGGHSQRVTQMTVRLAQAMGLTETELIHIRRGALLHDIGKMGIPDQILLKPGPLSKKEWKIMRQHPQYAYDMLSSIAYLQPALEIPYCHHEKWDGTGYPRGLQKQDIPLAARLFAIVDVWDALSSDRPYRNAWPQDKILAYLTKQSGQHFDPQVVELFMKLLNDQL